MTDRRASLIERLATLEAERAALLAELIAVSREPEDRLLTVEEAADILSVTVDWLYRHASDLPFTVRPGPGQLRFSKNGLQTYLKRQQGR